MAVPVYSPLGFRLECLLKEDTSTSGCHLYMVLGSLCVPGRFLSPGVYPCLFLCLKCSFPGCLSGSLSIPSGLSSAITISVMSSLAFLCKNLIPFKTLFIHFLRSILCPSYSPSSIYCIFYFCIMFTLCLIN